MRNVPARHERQLSPPLGMWRAIDGLSPPAPPDPAMPTKPFVPLVIKFAASLTAALGLIALGCPAPGPELAVVIGVIFTARS